MITTVTLNPAIDKTIFIDQVCHGQVNRIVSTREEIGGKGINVSKVLTLLGEENRAIGFLGKKNQTVVDALLKEEGLQTEFVFVEGATRTNLKVVERQRRITTDYNESGFTIEEHHQKDLTCLLKEYMEDSKYIVFSGSIPKGMGKTIYGELASMRKEGTKIVLDAEGELLLAGLQAGVDIIKPNIQELEGVLGKRLASQDEIVKVGEEWIERYGLTYMLVSMGEKGSILVGRDFVAKALPVSVEERGTVGAGDAMLGGFLFGLLGGDSQQALALAAACGTLGVSKEGTIAFSQDEVWEMVKQITIEIIKNL